MNPENPLLRQLPCMTLALAQQALAATLAEAEAQGVAVSIVLVDPAGQLVLAAHMDGAPSPSRDIAQRKAVTAAGFNASTASWEERLAKCSAAVRQGLPLQPGLALFGGGEPLRYQDSVIGAIGVSGASEALDIACAQAAVVRVQALLGTD